MWRKTSAKTASPVFEWKKNNSAREKFTVCFLVLSHTKLDNNRWLLSQTNEIMWWDCNAHLLTLSDVSEEKCWPIEVNAEDPEEKLFQLEKAEEKRLREEEKLKEQESTRKGKKENGSARGYDSTSPKRSP